MIGWPAKMLTIFKVGGRSTSDLLNVILSIAGEKSDCDGPACAPIIDRVNNMLNDPKPTHNIIHAGIFDLEGDDIQAWILSQAFYGKMFGGRAMPVIVQVSSKATQQCTWPRGGSVSRRNQWTEEDSFQSGENAKQTEADHVNEWMPKVVRLLEPLGHVTVIGDDDVRLENQGHVTSTWAVAME